MHACMHSGFHLATNVCGGITINERMCVPYLVLAE
jgi:hypothetical protein